MKITKRLLEQQYIVENKTMTEIAKDNDVSIGYISTMIKKFGLRKDKHAIYIGKKFGKLTPVLFISKDNHGHSMYLCNCDCGKQCIVRNYCLSTDNTKSCGCDARKHGNQHPNFKGYGQIPDWLWNICKKGADKRKLEFTITIQEAWELYEKQGRKCAITHVYIWFADNTMEQTNTTASIDRINPLKGYTIDNIQWVHKTINRIKQNMHHDDFLAICNLIAFANPVKKEDYVKIMDYYNGWCKPFSGKRKRVRKEFKGVNKFREINPSTGECRDIDEVTMKKVKEYNDSQET